MTRTTKQLCGGSPMRVAALALAAACAGVERPADWYDRAPPPPGAFAAPGPFDAMDPAGTWGVGDRVVYAIEIADGERRHAFTFSLTTVALPPARPNRIAIAHPVHGRVLTRSAHEHWQHGPVIAYVGDGPATLRAELCGDDGSRCDGEIAAEAIAHFWVDDLRVALGEGVHELFGALLRLDCVHATLLRVIRAPGLASVVAHLGRIEVGLRWQPVGELPVREQATPFGVLPTVWRPFTIVANGQPALDGRMQFTWKRPPLLLGAGVLQIEAWHPDDPSKRVAARLTSAVRGEPPDRPDPLDLGHGLRQGMTTAEVCRRLGGTVAKVHAHGRLADGRAVELIQFDVPRVWLFGVVHADRLLYASPGDALALGFLAAHGFAAASEPPP